MKKTLVALAVLAASGASFAQVTISGALDLGIVHTGAAVAGGATTTRMDASNGMSQIRFAVSEDLGGGMKANGVAVMRLSPEGGNADGTNAGRRLFQGETTVGLSGGFGALRLGRAVTAYQSTNNLADPWGTVRVASIAGGGLVVNAAANDGADQGRTDGFHYTSPALIPGLTASVTFGLVDQSAAALVAAPAGSKSYFDYNLLYAAGAVQATLAGFSNRHADTGYALAGSYNFGVAQVAAGFQSTKAAAVADGVTQQSGMAAGTTKSDTQLSVTAPFGAVTAMAGFIHTDNNGTVSSKVGLGLGYSLSKRTSMYANYGKVSTAQDGSFDMGVRHTF